MNVKLKALTAAVLAGFVGSASAGVEPPGNDGPDMAWLFGSKTAANLTAPERGAFAGIEAAMQVAEAKIYLYGCDAAKGKHPLSVAIDDTGKGTVELASTASVVDLNVTPVPNPPNTSFLGTKHTVAGGGTFLRTTIRNYRANADYDKLGGVMTLSNSAFVQSFNGSFDFITGKVIKDFYLREDPGCGKVGFACPSEDGVASISDERSADVPVVIDWGLQTLAKKGYTQAKYLQWSRSVRSDGVTGHTHWKKIRIYNAGNRGGFCKISVHTHGFNDADGFNQEGYLVVSTGRKQLPR